MHYLRFKIFFKLWCVNKFFTLHYIAPTTLVRPSGEHRGSTFNTAFSIKNAKRHLIAFNY